MKLLFYRYGSICEPDVIAGFRELGYHIDEITEEIHNKTFAPKDCIRLLDNYLTKHPVDFIFSINFFPVVSEVCQIYSIPYVSWIVDSPVMELYTQSIRNSCNRIFLFDSLQYQEMQELNPTGTFYLPLASNVDAKQQLIHNASPAQKEYFASEIAFVGSLYTEKCDYDKLINPPEYMTGYLNGLMEAQLKIYGYYFIEDVLSEQIVTDYVSHHTDFFHLPGDNYLSERRTLAQQYIGSKISVMERQRTLDELSRYYAVDLYTGSDSSAFPQIHNRGRIKTLTEMPLVFHASQINLNITSKPIRNGLPLRLFDILASGGFALTNYQNDLNGIFTPGVHLDTYGSQEELLAKTGYYLSHPKEREEIAANGLQEMKDKHTYPIRLSQMMSIITKGAS